MSISKKYLLPLLIFASIHLGAQNGIWTWMHGDSALNGIGNFGTQGIPAPTNDPPAMYEAASFTDLQGNFWVFGGLDFNEQEQTALWKFDPITNMWTWMKGPNTPAVAGIYGVQGVPSPANFPGSRAWGMESWVDLNGNFWIFGGYGYDQFGQIGALADLWKYDISTNEWTWMSGPNSGNYAGNYGNYQVPSITNAPPARFESATSWTSNNGDLWMFGGGNFSGLLNDMWRFNIATNTWTWMSGANSYNTLPNFGTQFSASPSNTPGARYAYGKWKDVNGNLWLFGGSSYDTIQNPNYADMWMYDVSTNYWTWMSGSNLEGDTGNFSQQCIAGNNYPSSRFENRCCWTDNCGRFWQYGGFGSGITKLNDLWMYDPATNQFTFAGGSTNLDVAGNYGSLLIPSPSNSPPSGAGQIGFQDNAGNFWMFGSWVTYPTRSNALWKYTPSSSCTAVTFAANIFTSEEHCSAHNVLFSAGIGNAGFTYHWDFGDLSTLADTSNASSASYHYPNVGTYTVTLIESANSFCYSGNDTVTTVITIYPSPVASFVTPDTTFCLDDAQYVLSGGSPSGGFYVGNNVGNNLFYPSMGAGSSLVSYVYIDSLGCSDSASVLFTVDLCSGINSNVTNKNLLIYPIPATDEIHIHFESSSQGEINLKIFDVNGKNVFEKSEVNNSAALDEIISLNNFANGIYLLRIGNEENIISRKIIVQKEN